MTGPNYNAPGKFPGPYMNSVEKDSSVMEYVPTDTMDIGARKSALPGSKELSGSPARGMSIDHVGGSTGKGK